MTTGFSRQHVAYLASGVLVVAAALAVPLLRAQRASLLQESQIMKAAQTNSAQSLDSLGRVREQVLATLTLERARAVARDDPKLHLVVAVDSGTIALVRDGITLRTMPVRFRGTPSRGALTIDKVTESVLRAVAATVDSLGNAVAAAPETKVERVMLSDGTVLEGADAGSVLLGGVDTTSGPRAILLSRRDFAAVRPNLVRGMKTVLF
jgi:hypothetical protein